MHYDTYGSLAKRENIRDMWHVMQFEYKQIKKMSIEIAIVFARKNHHLDILYDAEVECSKQISKDVFVSRYLLIKSSSSTITININRPEVANFNKERSKEFKARFKKFSETVPYHSTFFHNHTNALSFGINDFFTFISLGEYVFEIFLDAGDYIYIMNKQMSLRSIDWRMDDSRIIEMKLDISNSFTEFCLNNNNPKYRKIIMDSICEEVEGINELKKASDELLKTANLLETTMPSVMNTSSILFFEIGRLENIATDSYENKTIDTRTAHQIITFLSNAKIFTESAEKHFSEANGIYDALKSDFLSQESVMQKYKYTIKRIKKLELTNSR